MTGACGGAGSLTQVNEQMTGEEKTYRVPHCPPQAPAAEGSIEVLLLYCSTIPNVTTLGTKSDWGPGR